MRNSLIIAVLESYEVFRRQVVYYSKLLKKFPDWELVLIDDGSEPALKLPSGCNFKQIRLIQSNDKRPWSQPCARNLGAKLCGADNWLMFTDIDHIYTEECFEAVNNYDGHKVHFNRTWGILDEQGELRVDRETMIKYALPPDKFGHMNYHYNSFAIRKWIFNRLKGYDPKFCGKYGGDDTDFSDRYGKLHRQGEVKRSLMGAAIMYCFPDPKMDRLNLFHGIRREEVARRRAAKKGG